jgi:hypothetical protein
LEKSAIVASIVAVIRQAGGRFCKRENGAWFEVGDYYAREKVSALFRDKLHTRHRSSSKANTTQQYGQQLVDATGHSDDSSTLSLCSGSSTDSLGSIFHWKSTSLLLMSFRIDLLLHTRP